MALLAKIIGSLLKLSFGFVEQVPLAGSGSSPADSSPLTCGVVDRAYQVEVTLELGSDSEGGLLLFYNCKAFVGVGFTPAVVKTFQYAEEQIWARETA